MAVDRRKRIHHSFNQATPKRLSNATVKETKLHNLPELALLECLCLSFHVQQCTQDPNKIDIKETVLILIHIYLW